MVNININEISSDEITQILREIKEENKALNKNIQEINKKLDQLISKPIDAKNPASIGGGNLDNTNVQDIIATAIKGAEKINNQPDTKPDETTKKKGRRTVTRRKYKPEDPYVVKEQGKEYYNKIIIQKAGGLVHRDKIGRDHDLPFNINEACYMRYRIKNNFTHKDFNDLSKKYGWYPVTLNKLIFNLQENKKFNTLLDDYNEMIKTKTRFGSNGGCMVIDGLKTNITVKDAHSWCETAINSNKNIHEYILKLQKSIPNIDQQHLYDIVYNYNSNDLCSIFKKHASKRTDFVENNPSKRKNLIMNGGIA